MYRAIIWDMDGVLRHWDPAETRAVEQQFGLPEGALPAATFEPSLFDRAMTGRIPSETWQLAARNALERTHGEGAGGAADAWYSRRGQIDPVMTALVAALRKRYRTALLSNASTRLEEDLQHFGLDKAFDTIVNSARVGFVKPDPRIFHVAAARLGFPPDRCIFVDDTLPNVDAAREEGMAAIHFTGVPTLRAALAELGVETEAVGSSE